METTDHGAIVARERAHLLAVAYRMLGSRGEAEDVVQEALTRLPTDRALDSPRAFLTTVVTRLCLDELKSARRRRESYQGAWLPEPFAEAPTPEEHQADRAEASLALLLMLEQLSPRERVVFVLRELVDCEFAEIAEAVGASEQTCRKLLSRAREKVQAERAAVPTQPADGELTVRFFAAAAMGDVAQLIALLAPDASLMSDHGGKAKAARNVLHGDSDIARFLVGTVRKFRALEDMRVEMRRGNGGVLVVLFRRDGSCDSAITLETSAVSGQLRVSRVLVYRNPDKLARIA